MKLRPENQPKSKKPPLKVVLDREQRIVLEDIARAMVLPYRDVVRARAILKRQVEFIELLEAVDRTTPASVTLLHVLCDNLSIHSGKLVRAWLAAHPRFRMHFTPVHCSWMNQVEQWFSILQRKRLRAPNFADLADLEEKILAFIAEWNEIAHPFNWTPKSFDKVLNGVDNPWIRRRPHWTDALKAAA